MSTQTQNPQGRPVHAVTMPAAVYGMIMQYLSDKPYKEVAHMMDQMKASVQPIFAEDLISATPVEVTASAGDEGNDQADTDTGTT